MTDKMPNPASPNSHLGQVREGMKVYDRDHKEIGRVERVYLGAVNEEEDRLGVGPADTDALPDTGGGSLVDAAAAALSGDREMPATLRNRLVRSGFLQIEGGLFGSDRYILPDQIASVSDDRVILRVSKNDLVHD